MSNLVHIADRVINRPLMIMPEKLALIAGILEGRIGIDATELKELNIDESLMKPGASRFVGSNQGAEGQPRKPYRVEKGIATIQVLGSLVNRGAWLGSYSGMTSYEGLGFQIDSAARDADVSAIILDIDSPGGEAVGAFEVADKVAAAASVKSVVAVVNGMAASAAYAIASAANWIISTPSGVSGSIGVVLMHADYSHALHEKGIKPTLIHAGAHKVDGNPYGPLSDAVKSDLKAEVDQFYSLFVSGVAKGRKGRMTEKAIRSTEARTYIGQAALDAGLVDAIGSFDTALADLSKKRGPVRNSNPKRMSMEGTYSQADLDRAVADARTNEQTKAAASLQTQLEAATIAGMATGRTAERERISGILNCAEAKDRGASASHLALNTDLSIDAAKGVLSGITAAAPASAIERPASTGGLFVDASNAAPSKAGKEGDYGWGEIAASLNKTIRK